MNERIKMLRQKTGLSQGKFGQLFGVSREAVSQWEAGKARPDQRKLEDMKERYGVTLDWLSGAGADQKPEVNDRDGGHTQQVVASPNSSSLEFLGYEGARRFEGPKDLPILGHVKAGADGRFFDQGETHGVTMRPDVLMHVRQAYSVRVQDMSMFPAYEPNDLVYVNPTLAVVPDSNVVIQLHDGQAFVKRLIRRTEKAVICQEWYPEKREIKYDPKDVLHIHMIVRIK